MNIIFYFIIFVLGICIGSFINVVIYRLPLTTSIARGRSHCTHCGKQLGWYDLIPLLSFALLGGKCRDCKNLISWNYFFVELIAGCLAVLLWLRFPDNIWLFAFWLCISFCLLTLMLCDLRYLVLPDKIIFFTVLTAVLIDLGYRLLENKSIINYGDGLIGATAVSGFFLAIWLFSKGRWIGFGDVKLGLAVGLFFGIMRAGLIIYSSAILGGLVAIILLGLGKANMKTKLPLGTFICLSAIMTIIFNLVVENLLSKFTL